MSKKKKKKKNKKNLKAAKRHVSAADLKWRDFYVENRALFKKIESAAKEAAKDYESENFQRAEEVGAEAIVNLDVLNQSIDAAFDELDNLTGSKAISQERKLRSIANNIDKFELRFWPERIKVLIELEMDEKLVEELKKWSQFLKEYEYVYDRISLMSTFSEYIDKLLLSESTDPEVILQLIRSYMFIRSSEIYESLMPREDMEKAKSYMNSILKLLEQKPSLLSEALELFDKYYEDITLAIENSREIYVLTDFAINLLLSFDLEEEAFKQVLAKLIDGVNQLLLFVNGKEQRLLLDNDYELAASAAQQLLEHYQDFKDNNKNDYLNLALELAYLNSTKNEAQNAQSNLMTILSILNEVKNDLSSNELYRVIGRIGDIYREIGDYENLVKIDKLNLRYLDKQEEVPDLYDYDYMTDIDRIFTFLNTATGMKGLGNDEEAEKSFDEVRKILKKDYHIEDEFPDLYYDVENELEAGIGGLTIKPALSQEDRSEDYDNTTKEIFSIFDEIV